MVKALLWSLSGLKAAFLRERAFRQEVFVFFICGPIGFWLGEGPVEKYLLVGSLLLILIVELVNSAIESAVDRISKENHPLSGRAKDMGSAAVFLSVIHAAFVWILILGT
jgi:diacylglycerol kinase (ATP)